MRCNRYVASAITRVQTEAPGCARLLSLDPTLPKFTVNKSPPLARYVDRDVGCQDPLEGLWGRGA
jgi:hypothetical protein